MVSWFGQYLKTHEFIRVVSSYLIKNPPVSDSGLVEGAELIFLGKKKSTDYHEEMNGEHFEEHVRFLLFSL